MQRAKVGFVGFGEVNSPRELLTMKCLAARGELGAMGLDITATDLVTDDAQGRDVTRAIADLGTGPFDAIVVCIAGWIPSYAVVRLLSGYRHLPVILWGLAGRYQGGRLLTTADQAGTSALRGVLEDLGYSVRFVYATPGGTSGAAKVAVIARAAMALSLLRRARVGMMGYRDMNLYGTMFDGISLTRVLGVEIEFFEMLEAVQRVEAQEATAIENVIQRVRERWTFLAEADREGLYKAAAWYLALAQKATERGYQAISLLDVDGMKKLVGLPPAMVFMLLADELNLCTIPENDSLGAVTQLIIRQLTGQIAAYMEFYEFMEDRVLLGVPDYVPSEVVDGPVTVLPASFGNLRGGLLNVSKVKTGRVTLSRLFARKGEYSLHVVTGEAVTPRPWEEAGWTAPAPQLPGLEVILDTPVEEFAQKVMSQHYIVSYGDTRMLQAEFCALAGIKLVE